VATGEDNARSSFVVNNRFRVQCCPDIIRESPIDAWITTSNAISSIGHAGGRRAVFASFFNKLIRACACPVRRRIGLIPYFLRAVRPTSRITAHRPGRMTNFCQEKPSDFFAVTCDLLFDDEVSALRNRQDSQR